jgi:hypothetical protein
MRSTMSETLLGPDDTTRPPLARAAPGSPAKDSGEHDLVALPEPE